ncbi:hypothetical protein BVC80_9073g27 [Macleaya cordata]|uniref:NHL repeat n=1 Tax=Macleaya cordata TaxID=56857 RepID=A0A200PTT0_MACCD|nr:hypothetical protein BVC80_9073g27 [Macleaya cordata]
MSALHVHTPEDRRAKLVRFIGLPESRLSTVTSGFRIVSEKRTGRLRGISRILPRFYHSGILNQQARYSTVFSSSFLLPLPHVWVNINQSIVERVRQFHRFSTVSEAPHQFPPSVDLLTFLESALDELEGPYHCWLNKVELSKEPFNRDGPFLVLAGAFTGDSLIFGSDHIIMFERVKLLQRRHPQLHIFGFQSGSSVCSVASQTHIVRTIMKEYITFPILLSNKAFSEVPDGPCFLIFKDFKSPLQYHEKRTELGMISKAIEELSLVQNENSLMDQDLKVTETKKPDVIKEPYVSFLRNLLLYFPGCISIDEIENRYFLSDSNHHRIIIFDGNGKILDCIGSSPGFEDGDFESAKLLRPASSLYHAAEDCLYFVDSENHAIRKADIGRRTLETLYPTFETDKKISTIWSWILDKLGMGREIAPKSEEFDSELLIFPWHLMKSENNLLIINPSFQTLWIMDAASGKITEVVAGYQQIMEICGQMIMEKRSLLNQITQSLWQQSVDPGCSLEGILYDSLMSSVATFDNNIIFCDTGNSVSGRFITLNLNSIHLITQLFICEVGQTIFKLDRESGVVSEIRLSNFGILGLPYWYTFPVERVFFTQLKLSCYQTGRCEIQVNVNIPEDTELAAPLQEGCIWRQARGSAAEVSASEDVATSAEKVGVAQQWFEELDNLAFSRPEELSDEENKSPDSFHEDSRVHINSAVNISPGTSEVVIYAVLYLKLNRNWNYRGNPQEQKAKRIVEILNHHQGTGKLGKDACIKLMLESKRDMGEVIFMKPLHLRIGLECQDHPKADTSKEIILTDSMIEVNVSLSNFEKLGKGCFPKQLLGAAANVDSN